MRRSAPLLLVWGASALHSLLLSATPPGTSLTLILAAAAASDIGEVVVSADGDQQCVSEGTCGATTDSSSSSTTKTDENGGFDRDLALGRELVDWIRDRRGYVNRKLEVRRSTPGDRNSILGVFATDDIDENEILSSIPWELMVKPPDRIFRLADEEGINVLEDDGAWCEGVYAMIREMRLANESDVAPYANYLLAQPTGQLPSVWSDAGRKLLGEILGPEDNLPPYEISKDIGFWYDVCGGDVRGNDPFEEHVYLLVQARAEDLLMVPFYDMHNHRNGRYLNTKIMYENKIGSPFQMQASRPIRAGEQVYGSYNMCNRCEGRMMGGEYGTPEILRDYGFVEQLPQRWHFGEGASLVKFDLEEDEDEEGKLEVTWFEGLAPTGEGYAFLKEEQKRLKHLGQGKHRRSESKVPEHEWNVVWQYHRALTVAIDHAIREAGENEAETLAEIRTMKPIEIEEELITRGVDTQGMTDPEELIRRLLKARIEREGDSDDASYDDEYHGSSCKFFLDQEGYEPVDEMQSMYQNIIYEEHPTDPDKCMTLDNIVQICACYRPHYHEPFVHFPAAYLETPLKRVAFLGGGDSMLLHEVLKYKSIELVLGLELDQKVVRNSFKYFHTRPHFDDERVQWWFGDAAKSLLLLPKEYYGSFDLVLVDLSETVMSISVTEDLDIFGALELLLKPTGILVKNEWHVTVKDIAAVFDHAVALYLTDVPMICHQEWVMGSNEVNFLKRPNFDMMRDDKVETILYKPLEDRNHHYGLVHDYINSKNATSGRDGCSNDSEGDADDEIVEEEDDAAAAETKKGSGGDRAGILLVVEVEDVPGTPLHPIEKVESNFMSALKAMDDSVVTPLSAVSYPYTNGGSLVIVMKEGIVTAHVWPEEKYCALDVHLWGSYQSHEAVRDALLGALGVVEDGTGTGGSWSSYRVIVGGMFGSNTWDEDRRAIGPPRGAGNGKKRKCDQEEGAAGGVASPSEAEKTEVDDRVLVESLIEESLRLIEDSRMTAAVLCGYHDDESKCQSIDVLRKSKQIRKVVAIWTCPPSSSKEDTPPIKVDNSKDGITHIVRCRGWEEVSMVLGKDPKIHVIAVDPAAPTDIVDEAAYAMCGIQDDPDRHMLVVVPRPFADVDGFAKRKFFAVCLGKLWMEPKMSVDVSLDDARIKSVGIISSGNPEFVERLFDFESNLKKRAGVDSKVEKMKGSHPPHQEDYDAEYYVPEDYDDLPGLEQFANQEPLAEQSIFGYEVANGFDSGGGISTIGLLKRALLNAVEAVADGDSKLEEFTAVGDGVVLVSLFSKGHVILVWDGNTRVYLNVFTYAAWTVDHRTEIVDHFVMRLPPVKWFQHDEQPRGYNRVVNFIRDIDASPGCWDLSDVCETVAPDCKWEENPGWVQKYCRRTCGFCMDSKK